MKNPFECLTGRFRKGKRYEIYGPQGGISMTMTFPDGFNPEKDRCPMAILMHGFMSSRKFYPMPQLARSLARQGIASVRFDFDAHGDSEGRFIDMTIANEIADARAVFDYVCGLPYVTDVAFAGHSQGGVVAGMLAGELEDSDRNPSCLVLLAPAAVLKDDAIAGKCMGTRYNAAEPPEYVNVMFHRLGREFILAAQKLPIYETSGRYTGPVCIIHGRQDSIVPYSYSVRYDETYRNSTLHLLENEGHLLRRHGRGTIALVTSFLKENLGHQVVTPLP